MKSFLFSILLSIITVIPTNYFAVSPPINPRIDTLKIGIAGSAPFVINEAANSSPSGIASLIWEEIAYDLNWNYRYEKFKTVNTALEALNSGKLDMVIGPITINSERLEKFKFSQPFYQSSLAIVYKEGKFSIWNLVKMLFSYKLIIAIGIFLVILTIVGTFLWLAERKASPDQFPASPVKGIGTGMWLAIVTMSTTGYGDKAPITLAGRIIAGTWMIVSIISATSMVAGIASVLTFSNFQSNNITNIEQLIGKNVATVSGSPAISFLKEYKIGIKTVGNLEEAISLLKTNKADAIVYDRPQLLYYLQNHGEENLEISKAEYYKQGYGFAFPKNSELNYEVNRTLLQLAESQEITEITEEFLGKEN
jgi:polar amino acid transport system substrate-binding protein